MKVMTSQRKSYMYNVHACYLFQRETNFSITNLVTGDISGNSRRNHTEIETN